MMGLIIGVLMISLIIPVIYGLLYLSIGIITCVVSLVLYTGFVILSVVIFITKLIYWLASGIIGLII